MRGAGSALLDVVASASTWFLLGGLLGLSVLVHVIAVRGVAAPQILCDEFIHAGIADTIAREGEYAYRGAPLRFSFTYPLALAPAWLAVSMDTTYELIKAINAALMSSAAIPIFLWARRLVSVRWSFVAALLVLLMPAFAFSGLVMTENAAFPAFTLAVFAIAVALERPTVPHQLAALAAIGLAILTRYQHLVLLPVLVGAGLVKLGLDWRAGVDRRELRRQAAASGVLVGTAAVAAFAYTAWKWARGEALATGLGPYADLQSLGYPLDQVLRWTALNGGELVLAAGVVGASALVVLLWEGFAGRLARPAERAFVSVALVGIVGVLVVVGVFAASIAHTAVERYSFYAIPLLLLALVVWLGRGMQRPLLGTALAVVIPPALIAGLLTLPRELLFGGSLPVNTLTTYSLHRLSLRFGDGGDTVVLLGAFAVVGAVLAFALLPRRLTRVALPLAVAAGMLAVSRPVLGATEGLSDLARIAAGDQPTWVDDAIGTETSAPYLLQPDPDLWSATSVMLQTEFWNRAVDDVLVFGGSQLCPLPGTTLAIDPATGALERVETGDNEPISPDYVVTRRGTNIAGTVVADGGPGPLVPLSLYRVEPPLRIQSATDGLYADGWMSAEATYTQYVGPAGEGAVDVTVGRAGWGGTDVPGNVTIRVGRLVREDGVISLAAPIRTRRWVVNAGVQRTFRLRAPQAPFRVEVNVDPTFSPDQFGVPDSRQLGAQVSFAYLPPAG